MCGIVGYTGFRNARDVIISGLEKLEYRGYDSAGIAVVINGRTAVTRAVGKLIALKEALALANYPEQPVIGLGHTRWATHGRPSERNAHPHCAGRVSLVHNGIIENYAELKKELEDDGIEFLSETDTEIGAQLLNRYLAEGLAPMAAMEKTCSRIRGSYAFVSLDAENPDRLIVAKTATPVIIGIGEGENFVASDIPAVLAWTRKVIVLDDGDFAEVRADGVKIFRNGREIQREPAMVTWDTVAAQRGGHKHFLIKEILEQGQGAGETLRGRYDEKEQKIIIPELPMTPDQIKTLRRIEIVACGTAWHAGLVARHYFESFLGLPCEVDYSSEFRYRKPFVDKDALILAISQSGETADTLAALDIAQGAHTAAICNVVGSSLARKVPNIVFTQAGPEISVASTKAFTAQVIASYLMALYFAQYRGSLKPADIAGRFDNLMKIPAAIEETLRTNEAVRHIASECRTAKDVIFLGRGNCYPIALEGALKMKEISYNHAEGYPAGEVKHGPLALIVDGVPVVVLLQKSDVLYEKIISNIRECEARGGRLIIITDAEPDDAVRELSRGAVIEVPHLSEELAPILMVIPLQLLAYWSAVFNNTDVDLPRNLAKSVTVE